MKAVLCVILAMFIWTISCEIKLKQVQILFRHGDRAPAWIYPTDRNQADKWLNGLGMLTDEGIRQEYRLGLWLRERYSDFIGDCLNVDDTYVRSSNYDRTLMSAQSTLAGFVFKENPQIIKGLSWRPIAIHTVPQKSDILLQFNICDRYKEERAKLYETEEFKKELAKYQSLLEFLRHKSGFNNLTFISSYLIFDVIFCEKSHNMTVDDWVTTNVWKQIVALQELNWKIIFYKDLARLTSGYMLHTLTYNMKGIYLNNTKSKKVIMYSGHDTDIGALARLLQFSSVSQPSYATSIIFELYSNETKTDKFFVKVLYKNETKSINVTDVHVQLVPGCFSQLCPLTKFMEVTKHLSMSKSEFFRECNTKTNEFIFIGRVISIVAAGVFIIIILIAFAQKYK